jgi:hypothetical protein
VEARDWTDEGRETIAIAAAADGRERSLMMIVVTIPWICEKRYTF